MSETELKPCPFCGELPSAESLGEDGYYICCGNIDCESMDVISPEAWNTRPVEDALQERAEKAEADAERLFKAARVGLFELQGSNTKMSWLESISKIQAALIAHERQREDRNE